MALQQTPSLRMVLDLTTIRIDPGVQVRCALDEVIVAEYAVSMQRGDQFPPVVVFFDGQQHYLADGFHRMQAAERLQLQDMPCEVHHGSRSDALWFAIGANRHHGYRLNEADKKHAITLALAEWPTKSSREIAEQVGTAFGYVAEVRRQVCDTTHLTDRVTGKDGKSYPAHQDRHGRVSEIRALAAEGLTREQIADRLGVGEQCVYRLARVEAIPVLRSGEPLQPGITPDPNAASLTGRRKQDHAARLQHMRQMAERGYSSTQIGNALGISIYAVRQRTKKAGITVRADSVMRGLHRIDSNRVLSAMVQEAEHLCADVNLIEFARLDPAKLPQWITALESARADLSSFIRRLKEHTR